MKVSFQPLLPLAGLLIALVAALPAFAQKPPYLDAKRPLEQRVEDLLGRLTLEEEISLKAGATSFGTRAIERLGIPALKLTDGPNGVRSTNSEPTTAFPAGVALAATWNPTLIKEVGAAIGQEARALGNQVLLGPNINIQRSPLGGRNFESYSEDPVLAGQIGSAFVQGVQSQRVGATIKHFAANNQEFERMEGSSNVDERTLREIYLPAFETIVKQAGPWLLMAAYNKVNGVFASENGWLLRDVLKTGWGFDGVVVSDWYATHSTESAANAGLDLEMPGPPNYFGSRLADAVTGGRVEKAAIDDSVRRILRLILRTGVLDGRPLPKGEVDTPAHWKIARTAAAEAITLLKNDGQVLPLDPAEIRSIAVIGPNADKPIIQGGGSAQVTPFRQPTALTALRDALGRRVQIAYAQGVDNEPIPPEADVRFLSPTESRDAQGLRVEYFPNSDFSGLPVKVAIDPHLCKLSFGEGVSTDPQAPFSARWQGYFWPPQDGVYEFALMQMGKATLFLDGRPIIDNDTQSRPAPILGYLPGGLRTTKIALSAGRPYPLRLDYVSAEHWPGILRLGIREPAGTIEEAARIARAADVAIVFVGSSTISDTEGQDRPDMELPGSQNALVEAVLAANPTTVIVLNNGAPLAMPWIDRVPAILEAWLPGQEGAHAIADILLGKVNPSGKLPLTFPRRLEDNPAYLYYPGGLEEPYGEGVFVGYRYYEKKKIQPLFPFGHGLSYTRFEYSGLEAPVRIVAGQPIEVNLKIKNSGKRAGQEIVQLYVAEEHPSEARPVRELRRFTKVRLATGETRAVKFTLSARDLSYYDPRRGDWVSDPGAYDILVGASSADIRLERTIQIDGPAR